MIKRNAFSIMLLLIFLIALSPTQLVKAGTELKDEIILFSQHFSVEAEHYYRFYMASIDETCLRIRTIASEEVAVYVQTLGEFTMSANTHFGVIFSSFSLGGWFGAKNIDEIIILPYEETWCFTIINRHENDIEIEAIISRGTHILTAISCVVSSSDLTLHDSVTISGSISPTMPNVAVNLQIKYDTGSWSNLTTVNTDSNGVYSYSWIPEAVGLYDIKAVCDGYGVYEGATSNIVSVYVNRIPTSISCIVSPSDVKIGDSISVSGSTNPPIPNIIVNIIYTKPDNSTFTRTCLTNLNGDFGDTYTPQFLGSWSVTASCEGDVNYEGAFVTSLFTVSRIPTTVSCYILPSKVTSEIPITVSGFIIPAVSGKPVVLTYQKPDGSSLIRVTTTTSNGSYHDTYSPDMDGSWSVYVSWEGDENHVGNTSQLTLFIVDTTPPTVSITLPITESEIRSSTVTATWTGSDDVSGINHYEVRLDEGSWTNMGTSTAHTFSGLGDGSHTIDVKATDKAGNTRQDMVNFTVNTSLIGGPGWTDDIIAFSALIIVMLIAVLYLLKIRKHQ